MKEVDTEAENLRLKLELTREIKAFIKVNLGLEEEPLIDSLISNGLSHHITTDEDSGLDEYPYNIIKMVHDEIKIFDRVVDGKKLFDHLREVENLIGSEAIDAISDALMGGILSVRTILMLILMLDKAKGKGENDK